MMISHNVLQLAAISLLTLALSWFALRRLIIFLLQRQIVDTPNERSLHTGVIPRGGGLVIVAAMVIACLLIAIVSGRIAIFSCFAGLISAWALVSWLDDKHNLPASQRFSAHIGIAVITVLAYGWVNYVQISAQMGIYFGWFGALCTVFGILWFANLYNFMDGIDGLAAAQAIIGSSTIGFWFYYAGDIYFSALCVVIAASSYAFFLHNWRPAKIFMGDVGSITLGASFATLLVLGVTRYNMPVVSFILLFAVFIVDASLTITRRILAGEKFWLAHRTHYYQRLAGAGLGHSNITLGAIGLMSICSIFATLAMVYRDIIGVASVAVLTMMFFVLLAIVRYEKIRLEQH